MMFRAKLRTSFLSLLSGEFGIVSDKTQLVSLNRYNTRVQNLVSPHSTSTLCGREVNHFRSAGFRIVSRSLHCSAGNDFSGSAELMKEGVESLEQALHSSNEEYDWSELGSVKKGGLAIPKLLTVKPEPFQKANGKRKALSSSLLPAEDIPSLKGTSLKLSSSSPAMDHKLKTHNRISSSKHNGKTDSNSRQLTSVTIQNVPSSIPLSQLRLAMSTFGKISNASIRTIPDGSNYCDVEFENVESRRRALEVGVFRVKNFNLQVQTLEAGASDAIRI